MRSQLLRYVLVLAVVFPISAPIREGAHGKELNVPTTTPIPVYVGTYTSDERQGIYVAELDRATGNLSEPRLAGEAVNPSFLAIHPSKKFLYAVGEVSDFEGKKSGGVSAFVVDPKSGALKLINQMS